MCRKGSGESVSNAYATLTEETDVKPSARLVSRYVRTGFFPANPLPDN